MDRGETEDLAGLLARVIASWIKLYGIVEIMRAFKGALRDTAGEYADRRFLVLDMPADGLPDKDTLRALGEALPDNLMLVALPDPLDAEKADELINEFTNLVWRQLDESKG